ncbi:MAG: hypothetical protein RIM84_25600 [Alphaproteobacteria bacterium]
MDSQAVAFLQAMAALAVVAVLAFLVLLIGGQKRQAATPARVRGPVPEPPVPWGQFLAAIVLLVVIGAAFVWRMAGDGLPGTDWRGDDRSLIFFAVMLALALVGLIVFLVVALARANRRVGAPAVAAVPQAPAETVAPPSASRLLGLLLLAFMLLLMAWTWLDSATEYALMRDLIYPAALALTLVLLVDKASRAWNPKSSTDSFSEWLFCDGFVFLQVMAYLNLRQAASGETYAAFFFDLLGIALFFLAFWLVDRKLTRFRFLLAHIYLGLLPIGLLLWRYVQDITVPEDAVVNFWETLWPFFVLAVIGVVLEIIVAIIWRGPARSGIAAAKDVVFFVAYGVLLLVAIPAAA